MRHDIKSINAHRCPKVFYTIKFFKHVGTLHAFICMSMFHNCKSNPKNGTHNNVFHNKHSMALKQGSASAYQQFRRYFEAIPCNGLHISTRFDPMRTSPTPFLPRMTACYFQKRRSRCMRAWSGCTRPASPSKYALSVHALFLRVTSGP